MMIIAVNYRRHNGVMRRHRARGQDYRLPSWRLRSAQAVAISLSRRLGHRYYGGRLRRAKIRFR